MKNFGDFINEDMFSWDHKLKVVMHIHDSNKPYGENTVAKIEVEQDTAEKISNLLNKDKLNDGKYKISWISLEDLYKKNKEDYSKRI